MPIDYSKYPPNWLSEIRPRILKRADDCCEACGLDNHTTAYAIKLWVKTGRRYKQRSIWFRDERDAMREDIHNNLKKVKVVLTIAHLNHDEENHEIIDEHLLAMCQLCHLRYDAEEKYRRSQQKIKP